MRPATTSAFSKFLSVVWETVFAARLSSVCAVKAGFDAGQAARGKQSGQAQEPVPPSAAAVEITLAPVMPGLAACKYIGVACDTAWNTGWAWVAVGVGVPRQSHAIILSVKSADEQSYDCSPTTHEQAAVIGVSSCRCAVGLVVHVVI